MRAATEKYPVHLPCNSRKLWSVVQMYWLKGSSCIPSLEREFASGTFGLKFWTCKITHLAREKTHPTFGFFGVQCCQGHRCLRRDYITIFTL